MRGPKGAISIGEPLMTSRGSHLYNYSEVGPLGDRSIMSGYDLDVCDI